jgi:hypothetical protein
LGLSKWLGGGWDKKSDLDEYLAEGYIEKEQLLEQWLKVRGYNDDVRRVLHMTVGLDYRLGKGLS